MNTHQWWCKWMANSPPILRWILVRPKDPPSPLYCLTYSSMCYFAIWTRRAYHTGCRRCRSSITYDSLMISHSMWLMKSTLMLFYRQYGISNSGVAFGSLLKNPLSPGPCTVAVPSVDERRRGRWKGNRERRGEDQQCAMGRS